MSENTDKFTIEINGSIDLTKAEAWANGLSIGEGTGEMILTLKIDGKLVTKIKVHKLIFEGVKQEDIE
jgi:hypothetical protein